MVTFKRVKYQYGNMDKNRSEHIKIYLTEEEKKRVKQISQEHGLDVSSWARSQIKKALPKVQKA